MPEYICLCTLLVRADVASAHTVALYQFVLALCVVQFAWYDSRDKLRDDLCMHCWPCVPLHIATMAWGSVQGASCDSGNCSTQLLLTCV